MSALAEALVIGLAAWRIAALLSYETGPFDIFRRLREAIGYKYSDTGILLSWPNTFLANLFRCVWCLGLWVAAGCWLLWQFSENAIIVLAAATVLISIERWNNNTNG